MITLTKMLLTIIATTNIVSLFLKRRRTKDKIMMITSEDFGDDASILPSQMGERVLESRARNASELRLMQAVLKDAVTRAMWINWRAKPRNALETKERRELLEWLSEAAAKVSFNQACAAATMEPSIVLKGPRQLGVPIKKEVS
jgi:hypothetical protein